jgi:hypothetical protein
MQALFSKNTRLLSHLRIPTLGTFSHCCQSAHLRLLSSEKKVASIDPIVFVWARRNRELYSTQHVVRINIEPDFYAVAERLERQRKKRRRIAVPPDLCPAIVRNFDAGDLFGRMWGSFATTRGTRHRIGKGFEPDAGRIAQHKAGA